ncbi:MAG: phosphoglycolate phosphatase [Acidobacteriota bacterium]|nr:phosphoglycolate phosphatase [Acidobacteriota bacterium]
MPIRNLLFDLDGTLTDPAEGITRCYQFALEGLNRPMLTRAELLRFIGPPMRENFAAMLGADDRELVERAVALYRERFARVGLYENEVYQGVREMLSALSVADFRLFVATSKVTKYSALILEHFRLAEFFVSVHGATPDGSLDDKADLVARLLRVEEIDAAESVMIGDREHDIRAARRNDVRSVGVTYGYGSRAELKAAGANIICDTPEEVAALLLSQS